MRLYGIPTGSIIVTEDVIEFDDPYISVELVYQDGECD